MCQHWLKISKQSLLKHWEYNSTNWPNRSTVAEDNTNNSKNYFIIVPGLCFIGAFAGCFSSVP